MRHQEWKGERSRAERQRKPDAACDVPERNLRSSPHGGGEVDTPEQRAVALQGATESIVLLRNQNNLLPLDPSKIQSIAVIGPNAAVARTGGGGSSLVRPKNAVAPLDGIKERAGAGVTVNYALGVGMEGENPPDDTAEARAKSLKEATEAAAHADVAVVIVGRSNKIETEGFDLKTMNLPAGQDALIQAVEKANPRTIVVLNTGNPATITKGLVNAGALLDMFYGGEEGGHALAAILFGDANPSGRLPFTYPKRFEDSPAYGHYPGQNLKVDYAEGIYVGYRFYDTKNVEPAFPFGYGLSYTKFEYGDPHVAEAAVIGGAQPATRATSVTLTVKNTGDRAGAEVVQLYVRPLHPKIDRPVHELKGFHRIQLNPGETRMVHFSLDREALAYWSPEKKGWVTDPGPYEIQVGSSSRDIRGRAPLTIRPAH
ncbi:hypothetical protein DYQ86_18540 [Acidobacteria bacterium AB60]|nr:hypothetical protein DYQ86_18540 [Acidobacteria bacterium AB60]